MGFYFLRQRRCDPLHRGELFCAGLPHGIDAAKGLEQCAAPLWPDAGDLIQLGGDPALGAPCPVRGNSKAVSFVTDALQKE